MVSFVRAKLASLAYAGRRMLNETEDAITAAAQGEGTREDARQVPLGRRTYVSDQEGTSRR
jgi:hypothetical protein